MKRLAFAFAMIVCLAGRASAAAPLECRNMWEDQHADVDGPVVAVQDFGPGHGLDSRYRIVVRDHFTGCRVVDTTDAACKVGQHAAIVGGALGNWVGDDKAADNDYGYVGNHQWSCQ